MNPIVFQDEVLILLYSPIVFLRDFMPYFISIDHRFLVPDSCHDPP